MPLSHGYFYLESLKKNRFLCERIGVAGESLIDVVPCRPGKSVSLSKSAAYKLSRFAYMHEDDRGLVMESPLSLHKMTFLDDRVLRLVSLLSKGIDLDEITEQPNGLDSRVFGEPVEVLMSCAFVVSSEDDEGLKEDALPLATWEFHDLLFQARSRVGRHRNPSGGRYRFLDTIPPLPVVRPPVSEDVIAPQELDIDALEENDKPFSYVLENRMSVREFAETPISCSELGELLFRAARIKYVQRGDEHGDVAFRPYPGGGAIHELEIYPLVMRCQDLERGLYRCNPKEHQLERMSPITENLKSIGWYSAAAMGKPEAKDAIQVLLLITSRFPRLSWKYQSMAYATTLKGLGCLYQTLYLVATAMGLAPCAELLQKAEPADNADIPDGMDVPTELSIRRQRIEAIKEAKAEIERRAAERYAEEQKAYEAKIAERAKKEQETGKRIGGKPPQPRTAGPTQKDQVNLNDSDSRIMPTSGGGFEQAYNAQAGVDTETMLIVTTHVSQAPHDKQELEPALTNMKQLPQELGTVTDILADNGFFSEGNITLCEENKVTPYIAANREKHHPALMERFKEPAAFAR